MKFEVRTPTTILFEGVVRMVGDGLVTSFWLDFYIANVSIMENFLRPLRIYVQRMGKVVDMDTWVGECLSLRLFFLWRRPHFG